MTGKELEVISRLQEYLKILKSSSKYYTLFIGKDTLQKYWELIKEYIPYNVEVFTVGKKDLPHDVLMVLKEGK